MSVWLRDELSGSQIIMRRPVFPERYGVSCSRRGTPGNPASPGGLDSCFDKNEDMGIIDLIKIFAIDKTRPAKQLLSLGIRP